MKNVSLYASLFLLFITGCESTKEATDKIHKQYNQIEKVKDIVEFKTDIFMGNSVALSILDSFLILTDFRASDNHGMHLFNTNTLAYVASAGLIGNGPGEINRIGYCGIDDNNKILWVPDHGKKVMWAFPLDSILHNEKYLPTKKLAIQDKLFLDDKFSFLNDSIALGTAMHVLTNSTFDKEISKLNILTNTTEKYGYEHPEAAGRPKSYSCNKVSLANQVYVNGYMYCDLLTICNMDGTLRRNVYGPGWKQNEKYKKSYFMGVDVFNKHIIAAYNGEDDLVYDEFKRMKGNSPTKFLVFDLEGNYQKTLDVGRGFYYFCIDEKHKRIFLYINDSNNPLAYFNLNLD